MMLNCFDPDDNCYCVCGYQPARVDPAPGYCTMPCVADGEEVCGGGRNELDVDTYRDYWSFFEKI